MQEVRNQRNLVEQVKADLTLARSNHQEETARLQQNIQILKDEVEVTKAEVVDVQGHNSELRDEVSELSSQLEKEQQLHQDAVTEVSRRASSSSHQSLMTPARALVHLTVIVVRCARH